MPKNKFTFFLQTHAHRLRYRQLQDATQHQPKTKMKISAKTATKKIKAGTAWIEGKMSTGHTYPEGEEYWIITDGGTMTTHHVLVDDAPKLDKVKAIA